MADATITIRDDSWNDAWADACRRHPELLSVHESPRGWLALLLRRPLRPPIGERAKWLRETRRIGAGIIADLLDTGVHRQMTVLQLRPPVEVAYVLQRWSCRYDAEPRQRKEMTALADSLAVDRRRRTTRTRFSRTFGCAQPRSHDPFGLDARITRWYVDMTACWRNVEPTLRRRLILRVHRWIADAVVANGAVRLSLVEQLALDGPLARALAEPVPADEAQRWQPWIRLVLHDLRWALFWPSSRRTEAWYRWLFLIPYSIPVPRPTGAPLTFARPLDRRDAEQLRP